MKISSLSAVATTVLIKMSEREKVVASERDMRGNFYVEHYHTHTD
jgi:hypothetical protein